MEDNTPLRSRKPWKHERQRQWYIKNRELSIERAKVWQEANPARFKELRKQWKERNAEKVRFSRRKGQLKRKYNLTHDQFEALVTQQKGLCAVCGKTPFPRMLAADHDHTTGEVRGLLCRRCNLGVGWAEVFFVHERPLIRKMLSYLRQHRPIATAE